MLQAGLVYGLLEVGLEGQDLLVLRDPLWHVREGKAALGADARGSGAGLAVLHRLVKGWMENLVLCPGRKLPVVGGRVRAEAGVPSTLGRSCSGADAAIARTGRGGNETGRLTAR